MKRFFGLNSHPLRLWGFMALVALVVFSLTRLALLGHAVWFGDQSLLAMLGGFVRGLLRDLPAAAVVASPWVLLELMFKPKWRDRLRSPLFAIYLFTLLFVAVSEAVFWDEFSVRFNFIALDYLVFTTEVIGNIRESYPVGKIIAGLLTLTAGLFWLLRRPLKKAALSDAEGGTGCGIQWAWALSLLVLVWVGAYKMAPPEFSPNSFANELADNGWRSFIWAARQNKLNYNQFYATRPEADVLADLQRLSGRGTVTATHAAKPQGAYPAQGRPNIVVVMMESMSAEFMDSYGNKQGITPYLDQLAGEGISFTRMYAAGTRTVRGLEALSAALPPLPGKSVVRWDNISNLNTLGSTLAARGWSPHFLYGGYGMFDNMNGFFGAQNYAVTDRTTMKEELIEFENIWGVADEHLFDQVLLKMDEDTSAGKPVFAHIMTASNHVPFTYPQGRIDIASPGGRPGGVKYADYALGRFIKMAKEKPWFDNTIFLFVADHCARSAGKTKIPVYRYHIPAVIYAPKLIKPQRIDQLASQIDLAPTLLAMVGLEGDSHFVGRDILKTPPEEGRALLSTYQNLGYLKGDVMTVLEPKRKIEAFRISKDGKEAEPVPTDKQMVDEAIAYFQGAAILMDKHGTNGAAK